MASHETSCSPLQTCYTASGLPRYYVDVEHAGLSKYRRIKGDDVDLVVQKAAAQMAQWDEMWAKREAADARRARIASQKDMAQLQTEEAQAALAAVEGILAHTLGRDDTIDWDTLRDHTPFTVSSEFTEPQPSPPEYVHVGPEPVPRPPRLGIIDKLIPSRADRKLDEAEAQFEQALRRWQYEKQQAEPVNAERQRQYEQLVNQWQVARARFREKCEREREDFLRRQQKKNQAVDRKMASYASGEPEAILDYCDLVLSRSEYPDSFPQDYDLDYKPESRTLIVEYKLPPPDAMPTLKEVKYVQSRGELKETFLSQSEQKKLYDSAIYQIALRTVHELSEADAVRALDAVAFNGWVTSIDKATGQEVTACIVSLHVSRDEFMPIDFARVDPKACFKTLKGVGSSKLHSLAPVRPILEMAREDKRFVAGMEVADGLDESCNLAAMDWEDFEHLVRELFEKEFAQGGGEVKVTRASRDGGVDAIAFDPDPIRGGKIVIQAKRYTNVVGVAAVRDLYGTVVNEGATKGILVTTAEYGPDAYHFAKDKPLTLLNGGNLLHLLQKHGHKAKIDLREAKRILAEREKEQ